MRIRACALEPDRRELQVGQAVRLSFDALPGRSVDGHISAIAGAPEPRAEWGSGSYFVVDIELPPETDLPLLPGMSVRVVAPSPTRSEEHTSELQSLMRISYAVFCLQNKKHNNIHQGII